MFGRLDTCLGKSIGLWVVRAGGFVRDAPSYTEVSECIEVGKLDTRILWAIIRAKDFRDAML